MANPLNMECVYVSEKTKEYLQAQIEIIIGDDDADIYIKPQQMMSCGELDGVLDYLENDIFRKLKMRIADECNVYVISEGVTYDVELTDGAATSINELEPI
jgi:hypothetical protein